MICGCQVCGSGGGSTMPLLTHNVLLPWQRMADMPRRHDRLCVVVVFSVIVGFGFSQQDGVSSIVGGATGTWSWPEQQHWLAW